MEVANSTNCPLRPFRTELDETNPSDAARPPGLAYYNLVSGLGNIWSELKKVKLVTKGK